MINVYYDKEMHVSGGKCIWCDKEWHVNDDKCK